MTVNELVNKLMGEIPRMSQPKALDIVKQAWEEIVGEKNWTWTHKKGYWIVPNHVSNIGTVAVTRGDVSITFDATAITALNATDDLVTVQGRQFRVAYDGIVYTLLEYDPLTGVASLDQPYAATTDASLATYSVKKMYFAPPGAVDHRKFKSIVDPENGYQIRFPFTLEELDRSDPKRQSEGNPTRLAFVDTADIANPGVPRFELWPLPSSTISLQVYYQSKGLTDYNNVEFPGLAFQFPRDLQPRLIQEKCLELAYKWAEAFKGNFEELQGTNWRFLWQASERHYAKMLVESKKLDNSIGLTDYLVPKGMGYMFPVDAKFAQSHDVDWTW